MSDQYREVTRTGYFSNVKNAFVGFLFGLVFVIGAFVLLAWNEGNSVKTHAALDWAQQQAVTAQAQPLDRSLQDQVVYLTGPASAAVPLNDTYFGISSPDSLRLRRTVEMYQWQESKSSHDNNKLGGGTEHVTTYTYSKGWSEQAHDSSRFHVAAGHNNPAMPVRSETIDARDADLGDYHLTAEVLDVLDNFTRTVMPQAHAEYHVAGTQLYKGLSPDDPQIGDIRVQFSAVPVGDISIIGQQHGDTVVAAAGPSGRNILLVEAGVQSMESMFRHAHDKASMITWAIRAGGLFLMYLGFYLVLNPVRVLVGFIPGARPLLGWGISFVSFILSLVLTALTISIAWFAYRPLFSAAVAGSGLLIGALVFLYGHHSRPRGDNTISDSSQTPIVQRS